MAITKPLLLLFLNQMVDVEASAQTHPPLVFPDKQWLPDSARKTCAECGARIQSGQAPPPLSWMWRHLLRRARSQAYGYGSLAQKVTPDFAGKSTFSSQTRFCNQCVRDIRSEAQRIDDDAAKAEQRARERERVVQQQELEQNARVEAEAQAQKLAEAEQRDFIRQKEFNEQQRREREWQAQKQAEADERAREKQEEAEKELARKAELKKQEQEEARLKAEKTQAQENVILAKKKQMAEEEQAQKKAREDERAAEQAQALEQKQRLDELARKKAATPVVEPVAFPSPPKSDVVSFSDALKELQDTPVSQPEQKPARKPVVPKLQLKNPDHDLEQLRKKPNLVPVVTPRTPKPVDEHNAKMRNLFGPAQHNYADEEVAHVPSAHVWDAWGKAEPRVEQTKFDVETTTNAFPIDAFDVKQQPTPSALPPLSEEIVPNAALPSFQVTPRVQRRVPTVEEEWVPKEWVPLKKREAVKFVDMPEFAGEITPIDEVLHLPFGDMPVIVPARQKAPAKAAVSSALELQEQLDAVNRELQEVQNQVLSTPRKREAALKAQSQQLENEQKRLLREFKEAGQRLPGCNRVIAERDHRESSARMLQAFVRGADGRRAVAQERRQQEQEGCSEVVETTQNEIQMMQNQLSASNSQQEKKELRSKIALHEELLMKMFESMN